MTKTLPDNYTISIHAESAVAVIHKCVEDVTDEELARKMSADLMREVRRLESKFKIRKFVKIEKDGGLRK